MDALVTALKRAQQDAQEMLLESQIQAREVFFERARKRCTHQLEELRVAQNVQQAKPSVPPVDAAGAVARLQQMVWFGGCASRCSESDSEEGGLRAIDDQEFLEWMADRQEDVNAALMAGRPAEAARVSGVIIDATRSLQSVTMQPSMITNVVN